MKLGNIPLIHPGKSISILSSRSSGDIQQPSCPWCPSAGSGTVSILLGVEITVLDSTLATSRGSVLARKQLSYLGNGIKTPFLTRSCFSLALSSSLPSMMWRASGWQSLICVCAHLCTPTGSENQFPWTTGSGAVSFPIDNLESKPEILESKVDLVTWVKSTSQHKNKNFKPWQNGES